MKKEQRKRRKIKERFWSGSGKFLLTLIIVYVFLLGINELIQFSEKQCDSFLKSDIQIEGNRLIPSAKILHLCGFDNRNPAKRIEIDANKLAKKILHLTYAQGVSITRRPPSILNITIEEREPIAFIYGKGLNLIDNEGFLMPVPNYQAMWNLPLISGIKQLGKLGEKSTAKKTYLALKIVSYINKENPLLAGILSEINMERDNYIELYLIKGGAKVRINEDSFYKELYTLKNFIVKYFDFADLGNIEYIDLRFKDQLVIKQKT